MGLNFEAKQAVVKEITEVAANASSIVAAEYRGLNVAEITELRKSARDVGVYLRVVRNTLVCRALQDTNFACMCSGLTGQLVLVFSGDEPGAAVRVVRNFAKKNNKLVIRLVALDGRLLEPSDIVVLANLPSKEQALSMLIGIMNAPVTRLVRTFIEPHSKLVSTIQAVADKKETIT